MRTRPKKNRLAHQSVVLGEELVEVVAVLPPSRPTSPKKSLLLSFLLLAVEVEVGVVDVDVVVVAVEALEVNQLSLVHLLMQPRPPSPPPRKR